MEWILYDSYNDYFNANLHLSKLRDAGFDCQLLNENTLTIDPLLNFALGGIKLMVLKKDETEITELQKVWNNSNS